MNSEIRGQPHYSLPPIPARDEAVPAVMSIAGDTDRNPTPAAIYLIVKEVFLRAADALVATDPVGAAILQRASTHWLRHSAASHQADAGTDIRFIQRNLRHAPIETTGLYLHAEDDRRHTQTTLSGHRDQKNEVPA
jgi:site-specific recombinase XerC